MSKFVIGRGFCGPPSSGNGGYVCGVLAKELDGAVTSVLRARPPLETELNIVRDGPAAVLTDANGELIARGEPARAELPEPPPAPTLAAAREAEARYVGHAARFHPVCFTCGTERDEGDGLRVFVGQLEGAERGVVAGVWAPHANFAEADGLASVEAMWAALDCPGYFAWVETQGRHGALLGTMTGEVLRRPAAGEACIVMGWPIAREGRKEIAGTALYSADGELMARAHQVWITMGPVAPAASAK